MRPKRPPRQYVKNTSRRSILLLILLESSSHSVSSFERTHRYANSFPRKMKRPEEDFSLVSADHAPVNTRIVVTMATVARWPVNTVGGHGSVRSPGGAALRSRDSQRRTVAAGRLVSVGSARGHGTSARCADARPSDAREVFGAVWWFVSTAVEKFRTRVKVSALREGSFRGLLLEVFGAQEYP